MSTNSELEAALSVLIARTGHTKYRDFCNPAHPQYHPRWPATVIALAEGRQPVAGPTLTLEQALARWFNESAAMSRQGCCGSTGEKRRRFDPYTDLSAEERVWWPF